MKKILVFWEKIEELGIVISMAAMTLITCVYVLANNLYTPFFSLHDLFAESIPWLAAIFDQIGEWIMNLAQHMTWSIAIVKIFFTALIFLGAAYGVRTAGHIGVDVLLKLFNNDMRRYLSLFAALCCLIYLGLVVVSCWGVVQSAFVANIYGEDLNDWGIKTWHIACIVLLGFILMFVRMAEVFFRLLLKKQTDLGLADEVKDALNLQEQEQGQKEVS